MRGFAHCSVLRSSYNGVRDGGGGEGGIYAGTCATVRPYYAGLDIIARARRTHVASWTSNAEQTQMNEMQVKRE